jgi:hypothetical protein
MKHLSQTPEAPRRAPDIPHDLDLVVLRALAKEPAERYRTAASSIATSSSWRAATRSAPRRRPPRRWCSPVPARSTRRRDACAPAGRTTGGTYGGDERYRAYDAATVAAQLVAVGDRGGASSRAVGGWFLYDNVQKQISENKPVTVQQYTGIVESKAVDLIIATARAEGAALPEREHPSDRLRAVADRRTSLAKGGIVTIKVSTGKKTSTCPTSSASS